jgi:hypothetical protein
MSNIDPKFLENITNVAIDSANEQGDSYEVAMKDLQEILKDDSWIFDSEIWVELIEKIVKRNKLLQSMPNAGLVIAQVISTFVNYISEDNKFQGLLVKKRLFDDYYPKEINGEVKTYSVEQVSVITGLPEPLIVKHLNTGLFLGQSVDDEWKLTGPEISYIEFVKEIFREQ